MSINFSTTTHYVSGDDFVRVNPWFTVTLEDRFGVLLSSERFERRVGNIQRDNFPDLFSQQVQSSSAFRHMLDTAT